MREDTQLSLRFKMISGKKVTADFTGGDVSSDGGVLALREITDSIGIIDRLAEVITDFRHQSYVLHDNKTLLKQRILQIVCGYEDANDADDLRTDPGFKAACNRLPSEGDLASQPTISRFENAMTPRDIYRIANVLVDLFIASYDTEPKAIILDIDDTDDPTHGAQQLSLFNGYYDEYCYQPLFIFEGQSGNLITSILRPGRRPSGKETCAIIKRVVKRIRAAWPKVGILIRGDSHFATPELYAWCDSHAVLYVLGLTCTSILKKRAQVALEAARREYKASGTKARTFRQMRYQASTWHRDLRVIVMAEVSAQGDNIRFIVTSLESSLPSFIYETVYCGRGQMENFIKDHKLALKSGRTSCHSFLANSFRLMLHSAAYVILHTLREKALSGTEFANAQFDTIRLRLLKIGVEVREMKTKLHFIFPSSFPLKNVFVTMCNKIVMQM
ncbi:MAG: IS1380 family transposase [Candidatus Latescibacter sp.]|nr:IS1380 family transposase [Candidatus Latescibacter sp.]